MPEFKKDVVVEVIRKYQPLSIESLDKTLFVTLEGDKAIKKYSDLDTLKADYGISSYMYQGVTVANSQKDSNGNSIEPIYWYSASISSASGLVDLLEATTNSNDYYSIVVPFYDQTSIEALALWLTREEKVALVIAPSENAVSTELRASDRIIFCYEDTYDTSTDIATDYKIFAWAGRTFYKGAVARWKDRELQGVSYSLKESDKITPFSRAYETTLFNLPAGGSIMSIVNKYNLTVTNGSFCANGIMHIDQRMKLDWFKFSIQENLFKMMVQNEHVFMDDDPEAGLPMIEATINRVMDIGGQKRLLARKSDGVSYAYSVKVPSTKDTTPQTGITTDDLIARTLRNVVIEATLSTEVEYIQVKFVWRDDVVEGVGI